MAIAYDIPARQKCRPAKGRSDDPPYGRSLPMVRHCRNGSTKPATTPAIGMGSHSVFVAKAPAIRERAVLLQPRSSNSLCGPSIPLLTPLPCQLPIISKIGLDHAMVREFPTCYRPTPFSVDAVDRMDRIGHFALAAHNKSGNARIDDVGQCPGRICHDW